MKPRTPEQIRFINRHMKGFFEHILRVSVTQKQKKVRLKRAKK